MIENASAILAKYLHTPNNEWYGPFLFIVRDDEPNCWFHSFSSPTHMHVPETHEVVKDYGRFCALNFRFEHNKILDEFGSEVYDACWKRIDEIELEYYRDIYTPPWDGTITELAGWILPDGTYYECPEEGHDGTAKIVMSVLQNQIVDNARRKAEEAGWLCVWRRSIYEECEPTDAQKITVARILLAAQAAKENGHEFYDIHLDEFIGMLKRKIARWQRDV